MKMIRKYLVSIFIVMMTVSVFAQAASDSQIELPDLTTVVTGENSEEYAPAPDFTDVLNIPYDSGDLAPVLPAAAVENDGIVSSPVDEYQNKRYPWIDVKEDKSRQREIKTISSHFERDDHRRPRFHQWIQR